MGREGVDWRRMDGNEGWMGGGEGGERGRGEGMERGDRWEEEESSLSTYLSICLSTSLCSSLQKRLTEVQEQIAQINKEEELFKWTPTTYPQLEQVQASLEPFMQLFSTVLKWQKAEKKFMDGTFLEIDAEDTQAKVCVCVCVGEDGEGVRVK